MKVIKKGIRKKIAGIEEQTPKPKKPEGKDISGESADYTTRSAKLILQGSYLQAERELKKAIELDSMNTKAYGYMGSIFFMQGKYEEAIPWLEKALEIDPLLTGVRDALVRAKAAIMEN